METVSSILILAAIIIGVVLLIKLLAAPIRLIFKLMLNALMGFFVLIVVNIIGGFVDFSLTVNFVNAVIVGLLGIPGVVLLIVFKLFL